MSFSIKWDEKCVRTQHKQNLLYFSILLHRCPAWYPLIILPQDNIWQTCLQITQKIIIWCDSCCNLNLLRPNLVTGISPVLKSPSPFARRTYRSNFSKVTDIEVCREWLCSPAFPGRENISELNTEIRKKTVEMFSVLCQNRWFEKKANQSVPVNGEEFLIFDCHWKQHVTLLNSRQKLKLIIFSLHWCVSLP